MLNSYFYHERIRKSVAMFGSLFNNIYVLRKDASGKVISTVKVPLSYAPQRDFLERIRENPDLINDTKVAMKLPRMSFEILGFQYNPQNQLNKIGKRNLGSSTDTVYAKGKLWNYVSYSINMQLNIYAKNQDDALQIVEQILPFFSPQYTLTVKPFSDYADIKEDVPITLQGVSYTDDYEGSFDRRIIQYQLDFLMTANFYQGIAESQIIRKVINDFYVDTIIDSDGNGGTWHPTVKLTVEPNPLNVSPDSDYGFTETLTYYGNAAGDSA